MGADLLVPFQPIVTDFQSRRMLAVIGWLQPGVSLDRAAEILKKSAAAVAEAWPETHAGWTVAVAPFVDRIVSARARRILLLMALAVLVVLLIACANLANLAPEKQRPFVVIVSKTLAARQWPGESAVGKRIRPVVGNEISYWSTVIGVVDDIRQSALTESPAPTVYLPEYQYAWRRLFLLVHSEGDPAGILPAVRKAISDLDPTLPSDDIVPLATLRYQSLSLQRSVTIVILALAAIAVVLAAFGVYALLAYGVARRTQEFGVRIALGAERRDILRLVLVQGIKLTLIGEVIGIALALALSTSLRAMLFEVSPADPATYAAVAGFLMLVAVAACLVPGWRAAQVEPAHALRTE